MIKRIPAPLPEPKRLKVHTYMGRKMWAFFFFFSPSRFQQWCEQGANPELSLDHFILKPIELQ